MCWFAGFSFKDEILLKKIWKTLKYRAIDNEYFYVEEKLSFYHAHLSIENLDKDTSQPLIYNNLIIWLVWEIYNKEFLLNLVWKVWEYTELQIIWFLYKKFWKTFIDYINWEFSIFIFDKSNNKYFLYRDRWGTNNVYYLIKDNNLYFSSEIKSLVFSKPMINKSAFIEFMTFQFCISPNTIVEWINALRPWNYIEFYDWKIDVKKFWEYVYQENNKSIIDIIKNSIIRRIPKFQKRIFLSLSWGPDSNLILYFLNKYYAWKIIAYSFETKLNEREIEIANQNTKKLWIKHLVINMDDYKNNHIEEDIYIHEWLVNLPNLGKIVREKFPEYSDIKVEFWWDWKEELILWNSHFPYEEIFSRYKYFKSKWFIKKFDITQEFLNKEMFDYNLQMIDKITLSNWLERRMPFTDYELLKFYKYKNYRVEAENFLNSKWLNIIEWEFWYNLWYCYNNFYDKGLLVKKRLLFKNFTVHEK